jgi:hypothetical protein
MKLPTELLDVCQLVEQVARQRELSHEAASVIVLTHALGDLIASGWKSADSLEGIEQTLAEASTAGRGTPGVGGPF